MGGFAAQIIGSEHRPAPSREKLNASLALLPVDRSQLPFLQEKLLVASPSELPVLRDAMVAYRAELTPKLWTVLEAAKAGDVGMLPAAGALARYDPASPTGRLSAQKVAPALVAVNPIYLGSWLEALRPVRGHLIVPLVAIFREKARPETEHILATNILAEYGRDDPDLLAELLMIADPKAYRTFFAVAERQAAESAAALSGRARQEGPGVWKRRVSCGVSQRRAGRTAGPSGCGPGPHGEGRGCLAPAAAQRRPASPQFHRQLAEAPDMGLDARRRQNSSDWILSSRRAPPPATLEMNDILFDAETSTRRALILALGTFGPRSVSPVERERLDQQALRSLPQ